MNTFKVSCWKFNFSRFVIIIIHKVCIHLTHISDKVKLEFDMVGKQKTLAVTAIHRIHHCSLRYFQYLNCCTRHRLTYHFVQVEGVHSDASERGVVVDGDDG